MFDVIRNKFAISSLRAIYTYILVTLNANTQRVLVGRSNPLVSRCHGVDDDDNRVVTLVATYAVAPTPHASVRTYCLETVTARDNHLLAACSPTSQRKLVCWSRQREKDPTSIKWILTILDEHGQPKIIGGRYQEYPRTNIYQHYQ